MTEHETDLDFGSGPQTSEGSTATKPFDMPENFENDFAVWQEWLKKHEEITSALDRRIGEIKKHPLFDQFIRETWPSDADPDCVFGGDPEEDVPAFESWLQAQENTEDAETAETQEVGEQQQHRFPQPPTSDHPDINRILESAAEIMMGRISKQLQHVHDRLRSLPDELTCGDFFSGAGTFAKVVDVAFHAFQQAFPDAMSGKTVNHKFMCEKEHFKQQFLLTMFDGPDYADTCLFTDATTCFSAPQCARHPSRSCVMPQGPADGLLKLLLFNAGFSCKSFSKLHKDYKNLLQAIYEGNEESSSNVTFRASLEVLKKIFVTCFILENLDLQDDEEDGRGNFENIIKLLEGAGSAGFWVRAFLIKSVDYGTPQRRRRLFFVGLNKATQSEGSLDKIEQLLKGLQLSCQPPEDFMLPASHPAVLAELERKQDSNHQEQQGRGKEKDKDNADVEKDSVMIAKWKSTHMELAEKRQIAWPLAVPDDLQQCEWFQSLSFRERENVLFLLNERDSLRKAGKREVRFGDVYQSAHRVPKSSEEEIPTSLPSSKLWDLKAERLLIGSEMLHLQAIQFPEAKLRNFSSPKLINLAGNAYTATVMLALVLSTLMHLESPTPSEQEDEDDVGMLVQAVAKRQRLL